MGRTVLPEILIFVFVINLAGHMEASKSPTYNMNHRNRGICLIINNHKFKPSTRMGTRGGTFLDEEILRRNFRKLGFVIRTYTDVTKSKLRELLLKVTTIDHTNNDALVIIILSHGKDGTVYMVDGQIPTDQIFETFQGSNCPSLVGKPKLFFIQACRGTGRDPGVRYDMTKRDSPNVGLIGIEHRLPNEADFMVAYSTVQEYFSWRNRELGAWFIRELCRVLADQSDRMDLLTMMTRVSFSVAKDYESETDFPKSNRKKQQVQIVTSLTKDVFFKFASMQTKSPA